MSQVHTFPLVTTLHTDTRVPIQYPGNGDPNVPKQFELALLLEWVAGMIGFGATPETVADGGTIVVGGGNLINVIAVKAATGARTIMIGTSAGTDDVLEASDIETDTDFSATIGRYTSTSLTLHFTLTGGSASVLVFLSPET